MRLWRKIALGLVVLYGAFLVWVYLLMRRPPEQFAQGMAHMPMVAMMAFPFETLWSQARAGAVQPGDAAPDFDLPTLDKSARVRLAQFRGKQPVVLIFGSYT